MISCIIACYTLHIVPEDYNGLHPNNLDEASKYDNCSSKIMIIFLFFLLDAGRACRVLGSAYPAARLQLLVRILLVALLCEFRADQDPRCFVLR